MNVFLTLKCGHVDAFSFIRQVLSVDGVDRAVVFRDEKSLASDNVVYIVPGRTWPGPLRFIIRFIQLLSVRDYAPSVIVGIYEMPHGLLAMLSGRIRGIPSVVSVIGNPGYTRLRKGLRLMVTKWILKNTDAVTVTGTASRAHLIRQGIEAGKIFILPNTLDFTPFMSVPEGKVWDLISLGRISTEKHIEVFVRIVAELRKKRPGIRAAIGGVGPAWQEIGELVRQSGLEDSVDLCGFIPDGDLTAFFNKGRVFVLTSETEGFPRTIIQAAACGIPVVSSNVGDIADVIDHEQNGFLVSDYDNILEFSERINRLLEDVELSRRFSDELNKKVREKFNTGKAAQVWQRIFDKILLSGQN